MKPIANVLAFVFGLAAAAPSVAMAKDKINLLVMPFLSQAPFFIAMEEGFFAEQNIEVVPAEFSSFAAIVPGIMTGKFDMAMMSASPGFFNSIAKGAQGKIVAPAIVLSKADCEYFSFVGRDGVAWDKLEADEALGVTVSTENASVNHFLADQIAKRPGASGFNYGIRAVPPHAELQALKAGTVDLVATTEPWITRAEREDAGHTIFGGSELYENLQYSFFMVSPKLASENPDLGARAMKAISAGVAMYNEGKTERNIEILAKYTRLDPDFLREACWADISNETVLEKQMLDKLQDFYLDKGFMSEKLPFDTYSRSY